jgi:hypothetical protein
VHGLILSENHISSSTKKADAAEHLQVFNHIGLLVNGPPAASGLPLI